MKRRLLTIIALSGAALCARAQELDQTKEALSKWVETRWLISEEKEKWAVEREMLSDRIDLMRTERDSISTSIHETQAKIADTDTRREARVEENNELKNASAMLVNRIHTLETQVLELLPSVPPPVQERVRAVSQSIPKGEETDLSLSIRYQNLIYVLSQLNKAASEILVESEVRELADGTQAEGQTLYIGFACAYWCTNNGDMAQVGRPTPEGWTWEANDEIAKHVLDAIAIMKGEKVAEFIPLPVEVD